MRVQPRSADDLAKMLGCEVGTIHKLRAFTPHSFRDKLAKVGLVALANLDASEVELTKKLLSELKQYKGLNLNASDLVKIAKEFQG